MVGCDETRKNKVLDLGKEGIVVQRFDEVDLLIVCHFLGVVLSFFRIVPYPFES
jgi:hypothetical protein